MPRGSWTCQRRVAGVPCRTVNLNRKRKCAGCGGLKPVKRQPKHMAALKRPYEEYIALNGGEHCGVCGRSRGTRRLDRDHDHRTGLPRGLLCPRCNIALPSWMTPSWLRAAAVYLEKTCSSP